MAAAMLAYTHLAPSEYEGEPYLALDFGAEMTSIIGIAAAFWVIVYLVWVLRRNCCQPLDSASERAAAVHPGEGWVVLAHAVAFGSGYVLGASNVSFLLVLAVHHEVQYLYFTYAMARRPRNFHTVGQTVIDVASRDLSPESDANRDGRVLRNEAGQAAAFLTWPVIGFAGAIVGGWFQLEWLAPLGVGGLFCHYWLDSRIWTRRAETDRSALDQSPIGSFAVFR
jgi:hypothetical protein